MIDLSRAYLVLLRYGLLACVVSAIACTSSPPVFEHQRHVIRLSVYNATCGMTESSDRSRLAVYSNGLRCDFFLISDRDLGIPQFEGQNIKTHYDGLTSRYEVSGKGHLRWNRNDIEIRQSAILVNGKQIKLGARSVAVEADGTFTENRIVTVY